MAVGRRFCRLPLALQRFQLFFLFESLENVQVGLQDLDVAFGGLHIDFASLDLQLTLVAEGVHSSVVVELGVRVVQQLFGQRQVLLGLQLLASKRAFEIFLNGESLDGGLGPAADGRILRQVGVLGAFVEVLFDCLVLQCDQFVTRLDPGTVFDHPVDRAVAPDPALDRRVVGTLQCSLLDHGDRQSAPLDRVDNLGAQGCSCFGDGSQRLDHHLLLFLESRMNDDEPVVAVTECHRAPLWTVGGFHPAELPLVGFHHGGQRH